MTANGFAPGVASWLLAICLSRVGAYMVCISYAAALPELPRLLLYTLLALLLGGTYTTGILLLAEKVPPERRGRAMGFFLGGHSLGLALALVLAGVAIPLGGGAWGPAFGSLGLAGLVAVIAVVALHRDPAARELTRGRWLSR